MRHPELGLHVTGWQSKYRGGLVYSEIRRHHADYHVIEPVQGDTLSDNPAIASETSHPKPMAQHNDPVPWRIVLRNKGPAHKGRNAEHGKVIRCRPRRVNMFRSFNAG